MSSAQLVDSVVDRAVDIEHLAVRHANTVGDIELCVVIPTFNEIGNVDELVHRVRKALAGISWEMIFVDDDSPDKTAEKARLIARSDRRVRCIQRLGRRGLSSACVEGMLASPAPYFAVMDADLQHDETVLPRMLQLLRKGEVDLVVGSRYAGGGSTGDWNATRASMSRFATRLSRLVFRQDISDPMSGFFMLRRDVLEGSVRSLSSLGFKILLDMIASSTAKLRIAEVPYTFRLRFAGESKLDSAVLWEFGMLLADKLFGRYVPVRFVSFALVGGAGVGVHVAILAVLLNAAGLTFTVSQSAATIGAMVFNFFVNNILTYRDRQLRGWRWLRGLLSFMLACSVGALSNIGISSYLFENQTQWLLAALSGVLIGAVWNYAITQIYTWGKPK